MQHDEKEDDSFDPSGTDALGVDAWLIAAAHARGEHYQPKDLDALEIEDETSSEKKQTGYNPYNKEPKKP